MRVFLTLLTMLFCTSTSAEIYKCTKNNRISYQQTPCKKSGSTGKLFKMQIDITEQQQIDAKVKMNSELADYNETKQLKKAANDKERIIRAEENKATAASKSATQAKRQANAFEEGNRIARKSQRSIYVQRAQYPYQNRKTSPPLRLQRKEN